MTILLVSTVARIYQLVGCSDYYGCTHANAVTTLVTYYYTEKIELLK